MFYPKLLTTLKGYQKDQFLTDVVAGMVVGIVAIPLAIAFAIASGVSPERGLVTAVVAGFLISAFGGSRVQIGGPTGAFVIIIYGIVQTHGEQGLVIATFMAGLFLIMMGIARFGTIVKFIPHSVVVGFTSGIAVIIFSSQIKDFLGLEMASVPAEFIDKWRAFSEHISSTNFSALCLGLLSILIVIGWPKVSRKIPGAFIAIILTAVLVKVFDLPVETIQTRFGDLPHRLPIPRLPAIDMTTIRALFQPAFTIALLGAIESLLSAVVADGMIGGKHRSNMELVGQGIGNIGSSLFGGIPATGAIARTVINIRNGARTPVAGIVHAITILVVMMLFGKFIGTVPLACLAGILMVVAYHMSEWRSFCELLKGSKGAKAVLLITFLITVLIDLTAAIQIGVVLSAFLFMERMSHVTNIKYFSKEVAEEDRMVDPLSSKIIVPPGIEIYEINGPLFFGAANRFDEIDRMVNEKPQVRILRFRDVPLIDETGMHALKSFYTKCSKSGIALIIAGLHLQPLNDLVKANLYQLIGEDNVFAGMKEAIERAKSFLK